MTSPVLWVKPQADAACHWVKPVMLLLSFVART
jgi:hypothetical protein